MRLLRNRRLLALLGAGLCLLIAILIVGRVRAGSPSHTHNGRDVVPAAIAIARRAPIGNSFSVAGEFLPYQEIEVHAKVAGYIRKINVDIGDRVKTGRVLAVLEVPELVAELRGAGAGVRHSQQEIERAQNTSRATRRSTKRCMPTRSGWHRLPRPGQAWWPSRS